MNPVKQVLDLNTEYLEKTEEIFNRYIVTDDMLYEYMLYESCDKKIKF